MTNSFRRGSSPHRQRDAYLRPGSFKPGHKKLGGRKKGTPNRLSHETKAALVEAAARIGSDGTGKDGEVGYLTWAATRDEGFFYVNILPKLLERQDYEDTMGAQAKPPRPFIGPRGEPTDLVRGLMQWAVERPQEFLKSYAAVELTPPKDWRARAARNRGF